MIYASNMMYTNGKLFGRLAIIGFIGGIVFGLFLISGCETVTPYYGGGLGHTLDSGSYVARIGAARSIGR